MHGCECLGKMLLHATGREAIVPRLDAEEWNSELPNWLMEITEVADEIEEKVIEIVAEQMGVDKSEITRETSFVNDLNADSLDTVELVMEFEDEFELSIPDEEAEKIQTVGQAIDYIKDNSSKA